MSPLLEAFVSSWPISPWTYVLLALTATIYVRGWSRLRRRDPRRWQLRHLFSFLSGLGTILLALASPIDTFASLLLQVHMVQHLLLMMAAPVLLWLANPFFPLLHGLPKEIRVIWVQPILRWKLCHQVSAWLGHPVPAWLVFTVTTWVWHVPGPYGWALRSPPAHYLQHACFLLAALVFWHPVIQPYPSRPKWSPWLLVPYLLLADIQNTILSAILTFASAPLYSAYADVPRLGNLSALDDQATAGVIMWVPGSLAYLIPLFGITVRLLSGERERAPRRRASPVSLPLITPPSAGANSSFDWVHVPVVGAFLRWRHARVVVQAVFALIAIAVIYDGLTGPSIEAMNLAGVVPWIHWRGLLVLGLLAAGNVFCFGCPFLLPRTLARRWLPAGRPWPRWLRNKWPSVILLFLFFWAYEAFALWDCPWWTAWIALGYFAAPLVLDGIYRGAPFCKYVCPVGQFNFVHSLISFFEVKVHDRGTCSSCASKDCIRGRDGIAGCELHLFQPRKRSNLDCTFCLDCVHACPHGNVGILAARPAGELWHDPPRSSLGRLSQRPDLAALVLVLVFAAFANAAGMVAPVRAWQDGWSASLGSESPALAVSLAYVLAMILMPIFLVGLTAPSSQWTTVHRVSLRGSWENAMTYCYCLIPLGFGMWVAHYGFHFLASYGGLAPVIQRFAAELGVTSLGLPEWGASCCAAVAGWLLRFEILCLNTGLLLSLYTAYRIARREAPDRWALAVMPWAFLILVLFAAGIWIVFQPMQMRGALSG
jgi:cytochrome c oxidase assembly factor CtaG/polyferredoxin